MEGNNKTVLIIDDDPLIRNIIKVQLKSSEYRLIEASNKKEALSAFTAGPVHAALCDIKMKEESGFEILTEIHTQYPQVPVIMLTGFIEKEYFDKARELGCMDMIIKPVRKEKLMEVLGKAFNMHG